MCKTSGVEVNIVTLSWETIMNDLPQNSLRPHYRAAPAPSTDIPISTNPLQGF
jgi:hypothetical protein